MAEKEVLQGVVALVVSADPSYNAKPAIQRTLTALGAKVVQRLGKDVTHVVYERRGGSGGGGGRNREAERELLELYAKVDRLDPRPTIVSPTWVEESRTARRRLVERSFLIVRPKEALLLPTKPTRRTPGAGSTQGKKRKAAAAPPKPKAVEAFELGDLFTSSQQIRGEGPDAGEEVSSPRPRPGQHGRKWAGRGAGAGGAGSGSPDHGTDTQQAADIMTDLLGGGGGRHADTPGDAGPWGDEGWEEDREADDLETPLSVRLAKSASRSASEERDGGARRHSGPAKRSRLAHASGPHGDDEEGEGCDGEAAGEEAAQPQQEEQQGPEAEDEAEPGVQGGSRGAANITAEGAKGALQPAQRYSVRQLAKLESKPIALHKGTPLPGTMPPPTDQKKPREPIPIPGVECVPSPWQEAEQLPSQSQSQPSQPAKQATPVSDARRAPGGALQAQQRSRSLLQAAVLSPASGFKPPRPAHDAPWSSKRVWDRPAHHHQQQQAAQQPVPHAASPAAAPDGAGEEDGARPAGHTPSAGPSRAALQENVGAAGSKQPEPQGAPKRKPPAEAGAEEKGAAQRKERGRLHRAGAGAAAAQATALAAAEQGNGEEESQPMEAEDGRAAAAGEEGPQHGCIAATSVEPGVADLVKSAVRRLRGLRLCAEGREDGAVTHLVVGKERRTLKLMLAVANGAWLVTPEWVTASLEAGRWLPEGQYLAKVRFAAAAERARCLKEVPDAPALLHDQAIYFHSAAAGAEGAAAGGSGRKAQTGAAAAAAGGGNAAALKRVAQALGVKFAPLKSCSLCVVVGPGGRPGSLPKSVPCVKEEWLLLAAERFEVPNTSSRQFTLR